MRFRFNFQSVGFCAVAIFGMISAGAQASVSLKNGNFFVGYTDILYSGGFEPKVERVYNSKTIYQGIFGYGWGNEYEVYLTVSADGSVVVHEYGGGAENRFTPSDLKSEDLQKAVDQIVDAARKEGLLGSADQLASYKKRLTENAIFRNEEWEKFRVQGKVQAHVLKPGTTLQSNLFSYQKITKVADGYTRIFDNGKVEKFSEEGKLVRVSDKNNNFIELSYGKDHRLEKLKDNFNRRMVFNFNTQGLVGSVEGENSKKAEFKYDNHNDLVWSKDVEGNVYSYKYDRNHNMIEIGYSDQTTMQMSYYGQENRLSIKSMKDRDGTLNEYQYQNDPSDSGHYSVTVKMKASDGKMLSESKYEYFMKRKADGQEWQYKLITVLDGDRTETIYNECCGLPLLIKHGTEETSFEYDTKGHVTRKITPSEVTELNYDVGVGKVSKVMRYPKFDKKQSNWSEFKYDTKGNLIFAKNSDNKGVKLFYDANGRIKTMVDQNQRQINFKYNENSKPIEITDPKLGTITVSYSNSGEIKKVESTAGRKIALQVTSAFQNLLDIIRPAGVNLSF